MTPDQAKVCQALTTCQESYLTPDDDLRIARDFGDHIAKATRQLYEDTIGCEVDWSKANVDDGLDALSVVFREKYPWLPDEARGQIVHWFVMTWK